MAFDIAGQMGIPMPLAQTMVNDALGNIYDSQQWSFQLQEFGWLTPGLLFASGNQSVGTITTTSYGNTIVGDATAAAAWVAYFNSGKLPLLTSFQIRSPYYSLYNIIAFDSVNTFTIDRPWTEPPGSGQAYMVYQAYFPAPVLDFKRFLEIRDTTNAACLDYWSVSRVDLAMPEGDPQRTNFNQPAYVVPYEVDNRGAGTINASPTLGYMLYELWPHPLSILPYTISYERRGALLVNPSDTIPIPLTEEMVKWKSREAAFLWRESQKGDNVARGSGADFKFLAEAAVGKYKQAAKTVMDTDRSRCELYFRRFVRDAALGANGQPFANILGQLNVGRF